MKAKIDWDNANNAFRQAFEIYSRGSRKTFQKLATEQFALVVRNIIQLTPPMGGREPTSYAVGKKRGEIRIIRDIRRVFKSVDPQFIKGLRRGSPAWQKYNATFGFGGMSAEDNLRASESSLLEFHLSQRGKNKRVRASVKRPILWTKLERLQRALLKRQGFGPAGWINLAQKLNVRGVPAWIKRWSSGNKGTAMVSNLETGFSFVGINPTDYDFSVQLRVNSALRKQANNMLKQANDAATKQKKL
jgi:hypothetical protein